MRKTSLTGMQQGFSLMETIISIVALAFISIFILEMYMSASNLSSRAKDVDMATSRAVTAIESVKLHDSLSDYISEQVAASEDADGVIILNQYYDSKWEPAAMEDYQEYEALESKEAQVYYHLRLVIEADASRSGLYAIEAEVRDVSRERSLAVLRGKKYFTRGNEYEKDTGNNG